MNSYSPFPTENFLKRKDRGYLTYSTCTLNVWFGDCNCCCSAQCLFVKGWGNLQEMLYMKLYNLRRNSNTNLSASISSYYIPLKWSRLFGYSRCRTERRTFDFSNPVRPVSPANLSLDDVENGNDRKIMNPKIGFLIAVVALLECSALSDKRLCGDPKCEGKNRKIDVTKSIFILPILCHVPPDQNIVKIHINKALILQDWNMRQWFSRRNIWPT